MTGIVSRAYRIVVVADGEVVEPVDEQVRVAGEEVVGVVALQTRAQEEVDAEVVEVSDELAYEHGGYREHDEGQGYLAELGELARTVDGRRLVELRVDVREYARGHEHDGWDGYPGVHEEAYAACPPLRALDVREEEDGPRGRCS